MTLIVTETAATGTAPSLMAGRNCQLGMSERTTTTAVGAIKPLGQAGSHKNRGRRFVPKTKSQELGTSEAKVGVLSSTSLPYVGWSVWSVGRIG